jgi:hypothetical protein
METSDPKLMFEWIASWNDLVDFEVVPVMSSKIGRASCRERVFTRV